MTDKQIIIDGVDVGKCEYHSLNKNNCSLCFLSNNLICSYKPFCYYKQLKRKEQECEELKEAKKNSRCAWKSLEGTFCPQAQEQLDQLKAENEELKEYIKHLHNLCGNETDKQYKLKQTLTEIKEIAEKNLNIHTCAFKGCGYDLITSQILQKISEVEDGFHS